MHIWFFFSHKATMLPCRKVFKLCKANLLLFIAAPRGFDGALSIGGGGIVKSIGRGRGMAAAKFGGGGGGVSALGGLRRPSLAASDAEETSESQRASSHAITCTKVN